MLDKTIIQKEAEESKKIYNPYLEKKKNNKKYSVQSRSCIR